jgi:ubiquinone/menaquinone biosynthesis C-methylase UbiE
MTTVEISHQVQAAYDQIVEAYASRNHAAMADNLVALAEKLAQHAGPGGHIVDIGCGTGRDMAWFEIRGHEVTGVDLSSGMLTYAHQVVEGNLLQMDMTQLAFSDACFNGAWCCASLLHLPKLAAPQALREIHRVLKPGGMLILSIQEGDSEGWEEGYVTGVKRFFARYRQLEIIALLSGCGFLVYETAAARMGSRHWLTLACLANHSIKTGAP